MRYNNDMSKNTVMSNMEDTKTNNNQDLCFDGPSNENFVKDGKIYILGRFDESISQRIIPEFVNLIEKKKCLKNPSIEIYINSYGGRAIELLGLLSLLFLAKRNGIKIITYNIGVAASCGSILAIHGDERKMFRYAKNYMHLGSAGGSWETFEQLDRIMNTNKKWFSTITKWYIDNTKMRKSDIIKILKDDYFCLDSEQCLKYGFCDEII